MKWFKLFEVLRQGNRIHKAKQWKNIDVISGFLMLIASAVAAFGVGIELDEAQSRMIAGGLIGGWAGFHVLITVITSRKVGLPPKPEKERPAHDSDVFIPPEGIDPFVPDAREDP